MKKIDLKKLAVMGITGAVMIASQSAVQAGHGGCGGKSGCGGYTAPSGCGGHNGRFITENDTPNHSFTTNDPYMHTSDAYNTNRQDPSRLQQQGQSQSNWNQGSWDNQQRSWDNANQQRSWDSTNQSRSWDNQRNNPRFMTDPNSGANPQEAQLFSQLNEEGKAVFRGLDEEGKAEAFKLAAQSSDKNQAVKQAAQKMAQKRALNPNIPANSGSRW